MAKAAEIDTAALSRNLMLSFRSRTKFLGFVTHALLTKNDLLRQGREVRMKLLDYLYSHLTHLASDRLNRHRKAVTCHERGGRLFRKESRDRTGLLRGLERY